jgi:hypothetical protein
MDTRMLILVAICGFLGAGALNAVWFGLELRRFARSTPVLSSSSDLEAFKRVVAHQMHAALLQIVLLGLPAALFAVGIVGDMLEPGDILFVILPSVGIVLLGAIFRRTELKVRAIRPASPEMKAERDAIVQVWLKKPFPNW